MSLPQGEKVAFATEDAKTSPEAMQSSLASAEQPHSVLSRHQKRYISGSASFAGFIASISSHIYFPALNTLAHDLHVSTSLINLTITCYLIFQGLSPMFLGDFADKAGRRPAYIVCFLLYIASNIGLALQTDYAALFVLRCVQSAGISPAMALSSGIVSDITTAAERGSYMGFVTAGTLMGPAVGPVIGGLLAEYLGWRAIFWFLAIVAGVFVVQFLVLLPETARKIVGNGSRPRPWWNHSLLSWYQAQKQRKTGSVTVERPRIGFPNPARTLSVVFQKDTGIILLSNAVLLVSYYDACACLPSVYQEVYGLTTLQIGLCYLPLGVGAAIACIGTGKVLDYNYKRLAKHLGIEPDTNPRTLGPGFPIEKVRLQPVFPLLMTGVFAAIAFGWSLEFSVHLAVPTTMLFFIGGCMTAANSIVCTLLVDLYPANASAAAASRHFVRCLFGAGATAVLEPMLRGMGRGWCFTLIALVTLVNAPMLWVVIRWGPRWREQRAGRVEGSMSENRLETK